MSNPSSKTYNNVIVEEEVSLAIEQFFIAPFGTSYTPARISANSPPSGFVALGAVVEDSPTVNITRALYELRTGFPKAIAYQKVSEIGAAITGRLYTIDNKQLEYFLGNVWHLNSKTTATSLNSRTNKEIVTLSGSPSVAWAVGDYIACATASTDLTTTSNIARISSINGLTVVFSSYTFDSTPASHDWVCKITMTKLPFGTSQLKKFALIGVADFIDGPQVQHYFSKVSPAGDWTENIRPEANEMEFNFVAYTTSSSIYTGSNENIVGERFWIP